MWSYTESGINFKTHINIITLIVQVKEASFINIARPAKMPQKILLCGWRRDIDDMIVVSFSI